MKDSIPCEIESISLEELLNYMHFQADEAFPTLKNEEGLLIFATKLHNYAEFCVCRNNDKLIGMIAFYANGQGADFAYIPHVYVSPNFRKMGLFSRMLNTIEEYVRKKGFSEIRLEVENDNKDAQSAYLRNGFSHVKIASPHSVYLKKTL